MTEDDVARLRTQLGEGRRPRVALSGPQFEAGASGSVVRIGDPVTDGTDFLTVRVKVNGVTDELAFAPAELSIGRARTGTPPVPAKVVRATPVRSKAVQAEPVRSGSAGTEPDRSPAARPVTSPAASPAAGPVAAGTAATRSGGPATATPTSTPAAPGDAAVAVRPANSTASRRRKATAAPTVSVTISSSGAAWSVSASRGARTVAKNVPVPPGVVTAVAELLGQPAVSEAVAEINQTALQQARQRAEQLRAELNELEAVLATHRAPR